MRCVWDSFLHLIPVRLRAEVNKHGDLGIQELRLRLGRPPELIKFNKSIWMKENVTYDDLDFVINMASAYSPWQAATARYGYITAEGGHRIGICGEFASDSEVHSGFSRVTSVCIRLARDYQGIGCEISKLDGSTLIIGPPGCGKTTLLRDIVREKSESGTEVVVVDERNEIFPQSKKQFCFYPGKKTDVLSRCSKRDGIEMAVRTLTPSVVAVDEITAEDDCDALIRAGRCGIDLLATAHARNRQDLLRRNIYKPHISLGIFQYLVVLNPDKTWVWERMDV